MISRLIVPPCRYGQVQHYGGFTLSALMAGLIIALGVVYYTQVLQVVYYTRPEIH